jgi:hypothetical protein
VLKTFLLLFFWLVKKKGDLNIPKEMKKNKKRMKGKGQKKKKTTEMRKTDKNKKSDISTELPT